MTELIQVDKGGTSPEKNSNNPEVIPGMSVARAWMGLAVTLAEDEFKIQKCEKWCETAHLLANPVYRETNMTRAF